MLSNIKYGISKKIFCGQCWGTKEELLFANDKLINYVSPKKKKKSFSLQSSSGSACCSLFDPSVYKQTGCILTTLSLPLCLSLSVPPSLSLSLDRREVGFTEKASLLPTASYLFSEGQGNLSILLLI